MTAYQAGECFGVSGHAADIIPVCHGGFFPNRTAAPVANNGAWVFPCPLSLKPVKLSNDSDASPFNPPMVFFKLTFPN
jgi:hypothetical protein